ncbi:uncharacterized protein LOC115218588 [Octopus sinensis]|uniref:Uncharacterized protein LOC115218588 n=1 Tax=Octopus sinensis TaxID=2607531 RepID=A0A6P7T1W1_9MOLL|nr:uncharacterized protein LOC115218588 [Octopus sinensis]
MKMNTVFYLTLIALMFGLGTCAVVNMEPKMNKGDSTYERALVEKLMEKIQFDRMLENNDIEPQNEILVTELAENRELEDLKVMKCSWNQNIGECCVVLFRPPRLCIRMKLLNKELQLTLRIGSKVMLRQTFGLTLKKTFYFNYGIASVAITIDIETLSLHGFKACFRIKYTVLVFHALLDLGCINHHFGDDDISLLNSYADWNINDKVSFETPVFEADKPKRLEYLGNINGNENSLIWPKDAEKQ